MRNGIINVGKKNVNTPTQTSKYTNSMPHHKHVPTNKESIGTRIYCKNKNKTKLTLWLQPELQRRK